MRATSICRTSCSISRPELIGSCLRDWTPESDATQIRGDVESMVQIDGLCVYGRSCQGLDGNLGQAHKPSKADR